MMEAMQERVSLSTVTLNSLLCDNSRYKLKIPDYQRVYSWENKNVIKLLDDILSYTGKAYHLGNIILHKKDNNGDHNIVDGQQRLVTLALLLNKLDSSINISLLDEKFESKKAQEYIAYNKWLIQNYISKVKGEFDIENLKKNIQFSVLVIDDNSLDLAYTFFSNQNARGKSLTDYDLLKAHHLRYILIPEQAEHLATRWDSIILSSDNDASDKDLGRTLGVYLFRLRKWMRKREWDNNEKYKIKTEFEAAPIIPEIPPFGERFHFYETIQGGTHFFAYTDYFIHQFRTFIETKEFKLLNKYLIYEKHWWYREVIEAFLYAYYLKFGTIYLSEAFIGITEIISNHRYKVFRVYLHSLLKYAGSTELIMMIDQATSPTFFLAEMQNKIKTMRKFEDLKGTRKRYKKWISKIVKELKCNCVIDYK